MVSKDKAGHCFCPGTILSILSIFLYCGGFIRIEVQLDGVAKRLKAAEDKLAEENNQPSVQDARDEAEQLWKGSEQLVRAPRSAEIKDKSHNNTPAVVRQDIIQNVDVLLRMCQSTGKVCVRGPPGQPGPSGDKGNQGRRGTKGRRGPRGKQGIMGHPGRSGKQGIMGPPGLQGERGEKGDAGLQGLMGPKGDPGESISSPRVLVSPASVTVNETNVAMFMCSVSGNPSSQITWTKVGGSLDTNRTRLAGSKLQIKDVRLEDSGLFKCSARNILGASEDVATLIVQARPRVKLDIGPTYTEKGANATLPKCHVNGYPLPKISWSKKQDTLNGNISAQDGKLVVVNASEKDMGHYSCEASNSLGSASATTLLIVVTPPRFVIRPPETLNITKGGNISVSCVAVGHWSTDITWSRENGQIPLGRSWVFSNNTLTIWNVKVEDSGRYACTATVRGVSKSPQAVMQLFVQSICQAVGVSDINKVPDSSITASSIPGSTYSPFYGRKYDTRGTGYGWCAKSAVNGDYLQFDLGRELKLCAVETQGSKRSHWVASYKVMLSKDGTNWITYKERNSDKIFTGNTDDSTWVKNKLQLKTYHRYIRVYVVSYNSHPCMRVELYEWV